MVKFKKHEVISDENGYIEIRLYLDTSTNALEEFSAELGQKSENQTVQRSAIQYIKNHLPNVKYKKIKVMLGGAVIASILGMTLVPPASGSQVHAAELQQEISGGELAVSELSIGTFELITLNGKTQNYYTNVNDFTVTDPTGSFEGWNVVMTATPLKDTTDENNVLPEGTLNVVEPTVTALDVNAASASDINTSGGAIDGAGQRILSAPAGKGMGHYNVSFSTSDEETDALNLKLLPTEVRDGTYKSTISVQISSGPGTGTTETPPAEG